jgi:stringent starvation protein B
MSETRKFDFNAEAALRKNIITTIRDACITANVTCHLMTIAGITGDTMVDSLAAPSPMLNHQVTILNVSAEATRDFVIEDGWIKFMTMFKGQAHNLRINIGSIFQVFSPEQSGLTVVMPDTFAHDDFVEGNLPPERRKPTLSIVK